MKRARLFIGTYMQDVRKQRTIHLKKSAWTQSADSPLSDTKKAEWATRRQAMRDIQANVGSYSETDEWINFPDPPDYAGDGTVDTTIPTPTPPPPPE